jgi:hypothetical protein
MFDPLVAGEFPFTADRINDLFDVTWTVYQVADQTSVSTTNINSNYLLLPVAANSMYAFEASIFYDTSATALFWFELDGPTGWSSTISWWASGTTGTATNSPIAHAAVITTGTTGTGIGGVSLGTVMSLSPVGVIQTAAAAGTLQAVFSQNVTTPATNTQLKTGSWLRLTRLTP